MKIILTAIEPDLQMAWRRHCSDIQEVEFFDGSILDCGAQAIVSPANSFGFMDGGIDLLYLGKWGFLLQNRVQAGIRINFSGELPVGSAFIINAGGPNDPLLVVAPTMRVPMVLPMDTINPYLSARAALTIGFSLESIAFPGLGTGVGGLPADICAKQMAHAIRSLGRAPHKSWMEAKREHERMFA